MSYRDRTWEIETLLATEEHPVTNPSGLTCYGIDAEYAREYLERGGDEARLFYFDYEQEVAGLPVHGSAEPRVLAEEWRGYPAGSLFLLTYQGVTESPPYYTVMVDRNHGT